MGKIRKVVIPCAGLGTRFLPVTKTYAKEMLPIIDEPNLQFIVEECVESGIEEIIVIVSDAKPEIKEYFSRNLNLEKRLRKVGKHEEAELIKSIGEMITITYVNQPKPLGLGHAVLCAKEAINGEDFALILGDDLVYNPEDPAIGQLIREYEKFDASIMGVQKVQHQETNKYGIIDIKNKISDSLFEINKFVEKPKVEDAPSDYAILGRYIIKNSIFEELEHGEKDGKGEYQLTSALESLLKKEKIYAYTFEGIRYDIGDKFGYVKAIIDFSLRRDDLKEKVSEYIKNLNK